MTTKEPPLLADLLTLAKEHSLAVEACDLMGSTAPAEMRLVVVAALPTSMTLQNWKMMSRWLAADGSTCWYTRCSRILQARQYYKDILPWERRLVVGNKVA